MHGRHCKSSIVACVIVLGTVVAPIAAGATAPSSEPGAVVRQLVEDLDLQTKLPGDPAVDRKNKNGDTSSDANLRIPGAESILWGAIAVAVALVLYALKDYVPGFSQRDRTEAEVAAKPSGSVEAAERMVQAGDEADELAASGRVAEAIHLLLLRSLVELRRRLGISFADSLTSREILARLTLPEGGREALADLIRRVEFAHFGAKPSSLEDYAACKASYEGLIAAMLDPREPDRRMAVAA